MARSRPQQSLRDADRIAFNPRACWSDVVARLLKALTIFPAVCGLLVFAERRHEYERVGIVHL
ncbi:MAG UNVERIFIED_CONTAM: hypothetical protein LVR18_37385 [Planctomycetaceae bacterium]